MLKKPQITLILGFICTLVLTDCSKKETMEVDNETQSAVDYAISAQELTSVLPAVFQNALSTKGIGTNSFTPCDTLTYVSGNPVNFTPNPVYALDISNASCANTMPDGKMRSGKVLVRFTGAINTPSCQMVIKLLNYVSSGIEYSCDSIVASQTVVGADFGTFNVKLTNATVKTTGYSLKYSFNGKVEVYTKGNNSTTNAFSTMSGEVSGTNRHGLAYSASIPQETALVKQKNCAYITSGMMNLTPQGFKTRQINFGKGSCDDEASFTVNENTVAFKLK